MPNFANALNPGSKIGSYELSVLIQQSIADEFEAANRYIQIAQACNNPAAQAIMIDVAREEYVHAGEFLELLKMIDPSLVPDLEKGGEEILEKLKILNQKIPDSKNLKKYKVIK